LIDRCQKIFEQGDIKLLQFCKVVGMNIRSEVGVSHITAVWSHFGDDCFNRLKEIQCDELYPWVLPVVLKGAARGDDDFRPGSGSDRSNQGHIMCSIIHSIAIGVRSIYTNHSVFGVRIKCSTIALPLIPFTPVTNATLVLFVIFI
jgi:hypothetical protein